MTTAELITALRIVAQAAMETQDGRGAARLSYLSEASVAAIADALGWPIHTRQSEDGSWWSTWISGDLAADTDGARRVELYVSSERMLSPLEQAERLRARLAELEVTARG